MSDFWNDRTVNARTAHCCELCGTMINKGHQYVRGAGVIDGDFMRFNICVACADFKELFFQETDMEIINVDSACEFARDVLAARHDKTVDAFIRRIEQSERIAMADSLRQRE